MTITDLFPPAAEQISFCPRCADPDMPAHRSRWSVGIPFRCPVCRNRFEFRYDASLAGDPMVLQARCVWLTAAA